MNINDLNKEDRKLIENILLKERKDLTSQDVKILQARRAYIRTDEYDRLMIQEKKEKAVVKSKKK